MNNKIKELVKKEEKPLKTIKTVFPFTLFPDRIEVYRSKVIIGRWYLPFSRKEFPILISDIKTVTVSTSPFFASLFFEIKSFEENPKPIDYLKKGEAVEMRKILLGMMLIEKKEIDKNVSDEDLIEASKKLG